MTAPPAVWVLGDPRIGTRVQALAVAEALGWPFAVRDLAYGPLAAFPNALLGATAAGLDAASRGSLAPPWPDLVVSAGRRSAPVARAVRRRAERRPFLVHVMDPGRRGAADFGLIAQPGHDQPPAGTNRMTITGAPHRMFPDVLAAAGKRWRSRFSDLPRPWIAVFVGGSTRRRRFDAAHAVDLAARVSAMARTAGGALFVTTSRRTGAVAEPLLTAIDAPARVHRWEQAGENPYTGFLALADAVVVTGDSASMCSEACATGAPVHIFAPVGATHPKHARLHQALYAEGYARPFDGTWHDDRHPPLNAAHAIATEVRARLPEAE